MNFTNGEILKVLLRLIASACRSGLLIADVDARDERARVGCEGDEPELQFRDFTFGEIHQRFRCMNNSSNRRHAGLALVGAHRLMMAA